VNNVLIEVKTYEVYIKLVFCRKLTLKTYEHYMILKISTKYSFIFFSKENSYKSIWIIRVKSYYRSISL